MKNILTALSLLILSANIASSQTTPTLLRYDGNKLRWQIDATSINLAQGFIYKLYMGDNSQILNNVVCSGNSSPFDCTVDAPEIAIGHNVLEITATNGLNQESARSTALAVFYAAVTKETIINTEKQSVLRCRPGSYEVIRITTASAILPAFNNATKHVAFSYATATAVYVILCSLMEEGT